MKLGELLYEMKQALNEMKSEAEDYLHISVVSDFVRQKEEDYRDFKEIVAEYKKSDEIPNVIKWLKERGKESKFFGGMCCRGARYFEFNQQVKTAIHNEIFKQSFKVETDDIHFDGDYAIPDELDEKTFNRLYGEEIAG